MPACWDTSLFSRVSPGTEAYTYVVAQAARGEPVAVAAGAVLERAYGYESAAAQRPGFAHALRWLEEDVLEGGLCHVIPLDGRAALVAGRLRARAKPPPAVRGDRRSKARHRAAWQLDLQIAATCWAAGYDVATENRRDFEAISTELAALAPGAAELQVLASPV